MRQVSPPGPSLPFQYDPEKFEPTGGLGGWQETTRDRRAAGTEWSGTPLLKVTFQLWFEQWATQGSVEHALKQLRTWGLPAAAGAEPSVLQVAYAGWDRVRWVLQNADPDQDQSVRLAGGDHTRLLVSIELLEYRGLTGSPTPADSVRSDLVIATGTPAGAARTVLARAGDTLKKIAARALGNAARWPELAKLNTGIRDPNKTLAAGRKIKVPAR